MFPGEQQFRITYDRITSYEDGNIRTTLDENRIETVLNMRPQNSTLINYTSKAYVESTLHLKIPENNDNINQAQVECIRDEEESIFTILTVNKVERKLCEFFIV